MSTRNFTIPKSGAYTFTLPTGPALVVLLVIFGAGVLTCIGATIAILWLAAQLFILVVNAATQLVQAFSHMYSACGAVGDLVIWLVTLFLLFKLSPFVARSIRRTVARW